MSEGRRARKVWGRGHWCDNGYILQERSQGEGRGPEYLRKALQALEQASEDGWAEARARRRVFYENPTFTPRLITSRLRPFSRSSILTQAPLSATANLPVQGTVGNTPPTGREALTQDICHLRLSSAQYLLKLGWTSLKDLLRPLSSPYPHLPSSIQLKWNKIRNAVSEIQEPHFKWLPKVADREHFLHHRSTASLG